MCIKDLRGRRRSSEKVDIGPEYEEEEEDPQQPQRLEKARLVVAEGFVKSCVSVCVLLLPLVAVVVVGRYIANLVQQQLQPCRRLRV